MTSEHKWTIQKKKNMRLHDGRNGCGGRRRHLGKYDYID